MRKATLLAAAATFALGISSAKADVNVHIDVDKWVDINIYELVVKAKIVAIAVLVGVDPHSAAESYTVFNQDNTGNFACEDCAEKSDKITGSILKNTGITSVNQASGNVNNQGSGLSIAFSDGSGAFGEHPPVLVGPNGLIHHPSLPRGGFADSQVAGSQENAGNTIKTIRIFKRDADIEKSINENTGITMVNQATGNVNNQANGISIALSKLNGVALSDVALAQNNTRNNVTENESGFGVVKNVRTVGSINMNSGITAVNQSAGNFGNQANVVSVAATGF
jgi:hypothetical protein